jgi:hypothetical protein
MFLQICQAWVGSRAMLDIRIDLAAARESIEAVWAADHQT